MNKKAQEIEARTIMQGLEEFATFMSFQGNSSGLRILSVETVETAQPQIEIKQDAEVIPIKKNIASAQKNDQSIHKSLAFHDRIVH